MNCSSRFGMLLSAVLFVIVVITVTVGMFIPRANPHLDMDDPQLEVRRIAPPVAERDAVRCDGGEYVDFVYEVQNRGEHPVGGLHMDDRCSCEVTTRLPDRIASGGRARVMFRLRAPRYGTLRRDFRLNDESHRVVATFAASLRVEVAPPILTEPMDEVFASFVSGDASLSEIRLATIEERGTEFWIEAIDLMPSEIVDVHARQVGERLQPDPTLVARTYRFPLACRTKELGRRRVALKLRTRDRTPSVTNSFPLTIEVLDRIAIVPDQITVATDAPRRVVVVQRLRDAGVLDPRYDESLLAVRRVSALNARALVYEVSRSVVEDRETRIVFPLTDGTSRQLPVRIQSQAATLNNVIK